METYIFTHKRDQLTIRTNKGLEEAEKILEIQVFNAHEWKLKN